MKNQFSFAIYSLILTLLPLSVNAGEPISEAELKKEAISIVKQFGGILKPKLKQAIQSGGFANAIHICSSEAPKVAEQLSAQTGWTVKRVSLKPRNSNNAIADDYETGVLEQFNQRQLSGEPAELLDHSAIVNDQYRFIKAQAVEEICLGCHGNAISDEVKKVLNTRYPNDMATGYSLGQIRGAFSLTRSLSN